MSLLQENRREPDASDGVLVIRQSLIQTTEHMAHTLNTIHKLVKQYGRQEIAAALGPDAAEFQQVYSKLKDCLESIDASRPVDDLPS